MLADDLPYDIQLGSDGLHVGGTGQRIDFGRAEAGAVAAVSKVLGAQPESRATNGECGAGPVTTVSWDAGIDLLFQQGTLRGWASDSQIFITTNGYSAGMSRAQLRAAGVVDFEQTTLGTEFDLGGIYGLLLDPGETAQVDLLWAGVSCFFR